MDDYVKNIILITLQSTIKFFLNLIFQNEFLYFFEKRIPTEAGRYDCVARPKHPAPPWMKGIPFWGILTLLHVEMDYYSPYP